MANSKRNEIRAAIQQRVKRFSPFELLGLGGDQATSPTAELYHPQLSPEPSSNEDAILRSDISAPLTYPQTVPSDIPSDRQIYPQTGPSDVPLDPLISDPMIQGQSDSTSSQLDSLKGVSSTPPVMPLLDRSVPLAPLQWRVWQALISSQGKVVSYQGLASQVKGSIPGIRQAIRIIEREGGILSRLTVREKTSEGAILQGFRVALNNAISFHHVSAHESHRLQQRKIVFLDTSDRMIQPPSDISDGLRMYVVSKIHTYMPELLRLCPRDWQIREQTLVKIIEAFPEMSALEFRRSIRYLVEQSKTAKHAIQNPNAWLKAAFERNGGPLVTERMIEAQIDQRSAEVHEERAFQIAEVDNDLETLRHYVAASAEDKATIDRLAEERAGRLLGSVAADKHDGIRAQARIECAREFFATRGKRQ
jgi:hypothetical protein